MQTAPSVTAPSSPNPTSATSTVATTTPTQVQTPTTPRATRRPRGRRLSAADRARVDEALRDGRRLTRGGQHAEALARFDAALAIDRGAWRLECEAAFVAWRAENVEAADLHLRNAMNGMPPGFVPEPQRVPTAMCLFNAGLVHEARGRTEAAREMWEESLRLRPNDTVAARLAALPPAVDERRSWETMPATTPIAEIVAAMRTDFATHGLAGFEAGDVAAEDLDLEVEHLGAAPGLEVDRIHGSIFLGTAGGNQLIEALVVSGAGERRVALLGQAFNAGVAISTTDLHVHLALEDVVPGGQPELVAHLDELGGSVADGSECWGEAGHLLLCSVDTGALACVAVHVRSIYGAAGDDDEVVTEGYCRVARFEGGRVGFEPCTDVTSSNTAAFIEGTHELRALLARGDLAWPDTWSPMEPIGS